MVKKKAQDAILFLDENLETWGISDGMCPLCKDSKENLASFLLHSIK